MIFALFKSVFNWKSIKGGRMGRSDKVSLWWCVSLLINTRFRLFILEYAFVKRT